MPTIIDSLFLEVGLDPSKFSAGAKEIESQLRKMEEAAGKGGKNVEKSSKEMSEALGVVGTKLLELTGLFLGGVGITAFMGNVVKAAADLGRLSKVLDTNAQDLWAWERLGTQVGATSGEIAGSWQGLVHTFNDFAIGLPAANAKFIRFFTEQGVQFTDASGKLRSMTDVYMQLARVVEGMDPARAESYLRGLGLSPGTINLILQGTERLSKSMADAKKNAISDEDIKKATQAQSEFNDTWTKLLNLGSKLLPIVTVTLQGINNFAEGLKNIFDWLETWYSNSRFAKWLTESYNKQGSGSGGVFTPGTEGMPGYGPTPQGDSGAPRRREGEGVGGSTVSGKTLSGWPTYGTGSSSYLQNQRSRFAEELKNNSALKERLAAIVDLENPGAGTAVAESLMNRMAYANGTIASGTAGGPRSFYGPARNPGMVEARIRELQRNPRRMAERMAQIDAALAGSNITQGYTDQGSRGDPNYYAGGNGVNINGERFNLWGGGPGGHAGAAAFREQQQRQAAAGENWGNNARAVPWLNNPAAFALQPGGRVGGNTTNNSSTAETHVGSVTVHTQATDAYGIARDMKSALERFGSVGNANNGPN